MQAEDGIYAPRRRPQDSQLNSTMTLDILPSGLGGIMSVVSCLEVSELGPWLALLPFSLHFSLLLWFL